jgi:hypothetical protein
MLLPDRGLASANFRDTARMVRNGPSYRSFGALVSTEVRLEMADRFERMADQAEDLERAEAGK